MVKISDVKIEQIEEHVRIELGSFTLTFQNEELLTIHNGNTVGLHNVEQVVLDFSVFQKSSIVGDLLIHK
jgi:hypothetical protein